MTAQIVANATPGSIELATGVLVSLANFDNTGVLGWEWTLKDKPAGSASVLSAQFTSTVTFTPDIAGTYVVELRTYTDVARNDLDDFDRQMARCRYSAGFDWVLPGAGESTQYSANLGWKTEVNRALSDVHDSVLMPTSLKTANYTAGFGDMVLVDLAGAAGNVTITPPSAASVRGKRIGVQVIGLASGRQAIFDPPGVQTVSGNATDAITTDWGLAVYQSDGTNWNRIDHGRQAGGNLHAEAVAGGAAGFLSGSDKTKLNELLVEVSFVTVSGTSKTLGLSDRQTCQDCTNGAAVTITVPQNASVAFNIGTVIEVMQSGAGQVTIAGAGITFRSRNSEQKTAGQFASIFLKKVATDTWQITGDKAA